jgi:hypothetical protein
MAAGGWRLGRVGSRHRDVVEVQTKKTLAANSALVSAASSMLEEQLAAANRQQTALQVRASWSASAQTERKRAGAVPRAVAARLYDFLSLMLGYCASVRAAPLGLCRRRCHLWQGS